MPSGKNLKGMSGSSLSNSSASRLNHFVLCSSRLNSFEISPVESCDMIFQHRRHNFVAGRSRDQALPPAFRVNLASVPLVCSFRRAEISTHPRARLTANWLDAVSSKTGLPQDTLATELRHRCARPGYRSILAARFVTLEKRPTVTRKSRLTVGTASPWHKDFRADSFHGHTKRLCASPILARPKRRNRSPNRRRLILRPATPLPSRYAFGF